MEPLLLIYEVKEMIPTFQRPFQQRPPMIHHRQRNQSLQRSERYELGIVLVSEKPFCRLIKAFCDVVERFWCSVLGLLQFLYNRIDSETMRAATSVFRTFQKNASTSTDEDCTSEYAYHTPSQ